MPFSKFQQRVLEEEFGSVLEQFKGREIDVGGQLKEEVQTALRKKLAEMAVYEPAFASFTVTVTQDRVMSDRFIFDVHPPKLGLVGEGAVIPLRRPQA
jgi:hypothetical protein